MKTFYKWESLRYSSFQMVCVPATHDLLMGCLW